jgi:hypothetical protein
MRSFHHQLFLASLGFTLATLNETSEPEISHVPVCAGSGIPIVTILDNGANSTDPPDYLLEILKMNFLSQGSHMVEFQIKNTYAQDISQFFVRFREQVLGSAGAYTDTCYGDSNIPEHGIMEGAPFEALCSVTSPVTVVDVWVVGNGGTDIVPTSCHGDEETAVHYTFRLLCVCAAAIHQDL